MEPITQYTIKKIYNKRPKKQKTKDKKQNNIHWNGHNKRNVKLKYIEIKIQYKKVLDNIKENIKENI